MSRARFMAKLKEGLAGLSQSEIDEIASDYEFHFAEAGATGQSEDEIVARLGGPARLARELREEVALRDSGAAAEPHPTGAASSGSRSGGLRLLVAALVILGVALAAYYVVEPTFHSAAKKSEAAIVQHGAAESPKAPASATVAPMSKIVISGGQVLDLGHIEQSQLNIVMDGTGRVSARGHANELTLRIDGSGEADFSALQANIVHVDLSGTGAATVVGLQTVDVAISGSGTVRLKVKPKSLKQSITGTGQVVLPD